MTRRSLNSPVTLFYCASFIALMAFAGCGKPAQRGPARNVILVVIDTLRADRLGCYGYSRDTSPYIDQLATTGTRYSENRPQGSVTISSMISMMSGLYVTNREEVLPEYQPTLAQRVQDAGYFTVAFPGNQNLTGNRGFERGFDHFEKIALGDGSGKKIVRGFLSWFDAHEAELEKTPGFFAWIHLMDPHTPFSPPPEFEKKFMKPHPELQERVASWRREFSVATDVSGERLDAIAINTAIQTMLRANNLYDAEVAAVDHAIGRLVAWLDAKGMRDETLLIVAADHGEELYEQLRFPEEIRRAADVGILDQGAEYYFGAGHGWSFREATWKTPLILSGPGIPANATVDSMTANLDLYPTVLEALGIEIPPDVHGQSLLRGPPKNRSHVFAYTNEMVAVIDANGEKFVDRSRRLERYKGYFFPKADGPTGELVQTKDWRSDFRNEVVKRPEKVKEYDALFARWRDRYDRGRNTEVSDVDQQALRELGYLGDDNP